MNTIKVEFPVGDVVLDLNKRLISEDDMLNAILKSGVDPLDPVVSKKVITRILQTHDLEYIHTHPRFGKIYKVKRKG